MSECLLQTLIENWILIKAVHSGVLISQDCDQIWVTFASCHSDYIEYIKREGKITGNTVLRMQTLGPFNVRIAEHMRSLAILITAITLGAWWLEFLARQLSSASCNAPCLQTVRRGSETFDTRDILEARFLVSFQRELSFYILCCGGRSKQIVQRGRQAFNRQGTDEVLDSIYFCNNRNLTYQHFPILRLPLLTILFFLLSCLYFILSWLISLDSPSKWLIRAIILNSCGCLLVVCVARKLSSLTKPHFPRSCPNPAND